MCVSVLCLYLFVRVPLFLAVCVSVVTCLIYLYHCRCVYLCMYLVMCKYFLCIFAFCTFFFCFCSSVLHFEMYFDSVFLLISLFWFHSDFLLDFRALSFFLSMNLVELIFYEHDCTAFWTFLNTDCFSVAR